jgi:phosphoribosylglycinamide formyltransferase-1
MKRIAVFISGRGSNFMAIHRAVEKGSIPGRIVLVVSDNPDAAGLEYAQKSNVRTAVFEKHKAESHESYFQRIISLLEQESVNGIILAGFMKVLSGTVIRKYPNRILNIHPALLPSFPGTDAQKQAFDYGVKYSGCTVHFVDEGVDTGPIILQEVVPVLEDDDAHTLAARILEKEHIIYPKAVQYFCEDRLEVRGRKVHVRT